MAMFSIASINVNGLKNSQKRRQVFSFLKNSKYDVICLQETHQSASEKKKWEREWGRKCYWSHSNDSTSGVGILFRPHLDVKFIEEEMDFNGRILRVTFQFEGLKLQLLTIYGPNPTETAESDDFFQSLQEFCDPSVPCILLGDFNMVQNLDLDRCGGNPRPLHMYGNGNLQNFLDHQNLSDIWRVLHPVTPRFTWRNNFYGIKSRLDRIYLPIEWENRVTSCKISPFSFSDHDIVDVKVQLPVPVVKGTGFWKFNTTLLDDTYFKRHIEDFYNDLDDRCDEFGNQAEFWDYAKSGFKRIAIWHSVKNSRKKNSDRQNILSQIENEYSKPNPNDDVIEDLREMLRKMDVARAQKIFVQTHSRYLEEGERPTRYFFSSLKAREESNLITELYVRQQDGTVRSTFDQTEIRAEIVDYYEKLFTKEQNLDKDLQAWFLNHVKRKLSQTDRAELDKKLTKKDLKKALFQTEKGKTPGWDGLPYEFYKFFWDMLGSRFYKMQDYCLNDICRLTDTQRKSIITLLFKGGEPQDITNWRPISLLCCDRKIITKAIANNLKQYLKIVIHEDQTCAVPGRSIFTNLFLTRDIIRYTGQKDIPGYIITVDQEKAFDRVDREFLIDAMKEMNFGPRFIQWIQTLFRDSEACVLVNGHMSVFFNTTRSVTQGGPESQQLYNIIGDVLGEAIRDHKKIIGIRLPGNCIVVTTQYADDFTFYIRTSTSCHYLFHLLHLFELATGARIKRKKTKGICLGGAKPLQEQGIHITWVNHTGLPSLGVRFFPDQLRQTNFNWSEAIQRLTEFSQTHITRKLSLKGKVMLLNMLGLAQNWHMGTTLPPPDWLRPKIEHIIFKFFWDNSKSEQIARKTIYLPKKQGGLGLLDPKTMSTALRTKFFRQVVDPKSTSKWVHLARYWCGLALGRHRSEWSFLRSNTVPKLVLPRIIYPEFYEDCVHFLQGTPKDAQISWTTRDIRAEIQLRSYKEPTAHRLWLELGKVDTDWEKAWPGTYPTYASGYQQDIHYKFLHQALYTNKLVSRFRDRQQHPHCDMCLAHGRETIEDVFHLFFKCRHADTIWNKITPLITTFFTKTIRRVQFLFNNFPEKTPTRIQQLVLSIMQITIQQIWMDRNFFKHRGVIPDPDRTKKKIFIIVGNMITANFNVHYREHTLKKFDEKFYVSKDFCFIKDGKLILPFLH